MKPTNRQALQRDNRNLVVFRGDSLQVRVSVHDLDGNPVDVSGADNIVFAISESAGEAPLITYEYVAGTVQMGGTNDFSVTLAPADTATLTNTVYWPEYHSATINHIDRRSIDSSYYYEARVIDGDRVSTVLSGRLFVRASSIEEA